MEESRSSRKAADPEAYKEAENKWSKPNQNERKHRSRSNRKNEDPEAYKETENKWSKPNQNERKQRSRSNRKNEDPEAFKAANNERQIKWRESKGKTPEDRLGAFREKTMFG